MSGVLLLVIIEKFKTVFRLVSTCWRFLFSKNTILLIVLLFFVNATTYLDDSNDGQDECVNVTVEGTTATFTALMKVDGYFGIRYSENSSLTPYTDTTGVYATDGNVVVQTVLSLTPGQKYYYKALESSDGINWTVITPLDAQTRCFTIPPSSTAITNFKFVILADLTTYAAIDGHGNILPGADKTKIECFSNPIKAINPDFIVWLGDDIGLTAATDSPAYDIANHIAHFLGRADFGIPQYMVTGNHELELGQSFCIENYSGCLFSNCGLCNATLCDLWKESGDNYYPLVNRQTYVKGWTNGVAGRYGYIDWGNTRLIFLNPYVYSTEQPLDPMEDGKCQRSLGTAQTTFYQNAVASWDGNVMIFLHQLLHSPHDPESYLYSYGWGGVDNRTDGMYWYLEDCNYSELFAPIINRKNSYVFQGHSHYYARELVGEAVVYTCPSIGAPRRRTSAGETEYYGWDEEFPWSADAYASLVVEVNTNPSMQTVKVWGLNELGTVDDNVVIDTYDEGTEGSTTTSVSTTTTSSVSTTTAQSTTTTTSVLPSTTTTIQPTTSTTSVIPSTTSTVSSTTTVQPTTTTTSVPPSTTTTSVPTSTTTSVSTSTTVQPTTTTSVSTTTSIAPTTTSSVITTTVKTTTSTTSVIPSTTTSVATTTTTVQPTTTTVTSSTTSPSASTTQPTTSTTTSLFINTTTVPLTTTTSSSSTPTTTTTIQVNIINATSLRKQISGPTMFDKKNVWMILLAEGHHFNQQASSIKLVGPREVYRGVSLNKLRKIFSLGQLILVPLTIQKGATSGDWRIEITTLLSNPVQEHQVKGTFNIR